MRPRTVNQTTLIPKKTSSGSSKDLRKIIFKNGSGASMVLFKDIDYVNASVRVNALQSMYHDWRGKLIIVR